MNKEQKTNSDSSSRRTRTIKFIKPALISIVSLALVGGITFKITATMAEQSGSTPESGVTSHIKQLYTDLQGLTYGSDSDTPDWGTFWNRIKTAAKWAPPGNLVVTDVKTGKNFYNLNRSQQTGTYPAPSNCSTEQYHDSYGAPVTQTTNCVNDVTWAANTSPVAGDDAKGFDPRTGLTWSQLLLNSGGTPTFSPTTNSAWNWDGTYGFTVTSANANAGATYTNNGQTFTVVTTIAASTILSTTGTGVPAASGTLTKATGTGDATITFSAFAGTNNVAVGGKTAKQLCSDRGNGWRLPTQKELMQAYIDGSYFNLTQPSYNFWSATEASATIAWYVVLNSGTTNNNYKSTYSYQVRCVR